MIERAIEDWLGKASERGYQPAFCQLLNAMGYTVVHSTTHGAAEEGKDIIALDPRRRLVAFQLKTGNIGLSVWREILPQVTELVEQPISHPSITNQRQHRSVLVTTGHIHEEVARRIGGRNDRWRQRPFRPLETWAGSQLLTRFLEHTGRFLPCPLPDFHRLLGFVIHKGQGLLDKAEFDLLLRSVLPVDARAASVSNADVSRSFPAAAIITEYAMAGFDRCQNHFARVEACVMLACYVWSTAVRHRLPQRSWGPTIDLLERALDRHVGLLAKEAKQLTSFGQGDPLTDPMVAGYRNALVAGVLSAHGLWYALGGRSEWLGQQVDDIKATVASCCERAGIPSEAFVPAFFLAAEFLRRQGSAQEGERIFCLLLAHSVLRKQKNPRTKPLWGPYLPVEEAILRDMGKPLDPKDKEAWEERSITAWPLILLAARRLMRQDLEMIWHPITAMHFTEVVPDRNYQRLLWRIEKGTWAERMVPRPQRWGALRKEAKKAADIPRPLGSALHWLPYYLLVYPHRFSAGPVLALDEALSNAV